MLHQQEPPITRYQHGSWGIFAGFVVPLLGPSNYIPPPYGGFIMPVLGDRMLAEGAAGGSQTQNQKQKQKQSKHTGNFRAPRLEP